MIRRACSGTEALHLLHKERNEGAWVLDAGLGLLVEVALVCRSTALGDHEESVLHAFCGLDVDLGREVALCVDLVVHVQRGILGVAEILLCVGLEDSEGNGLLILEAGPDLLALLTVDNGCAGVLAKREFALCSDFSIAEESEGDILVVLACLRIAEDLGHLLVVGAAEKEAHIAESGVGHEGESLRSDLQHRLSLKFSSRNQALGARDLVVLGRVRTKLEHWSVLECCTHLLMINKKLSDVSE